jgi:hypothetical protein
MLQLQRCRDMGDGDGETDPADAIFMGNKSSRSITDSL